MLGSATDAEDVLQDAWLRWHAVDRSGGPTQLRSWPMVTTCVSTELSSARARREVYVGPWLPEPVISGDGVDGALASRPRRPAGERRFRPPGGPGAAVPRRVAAYVLREAFAYSSREVADLIGTTEGNARQLHSRARRRVTEGAVAAGSRHRAVAGPDHALPARRPRRGRGRAGGGPGRRRRVEGPRRRIVNAARRPVQGRENVARYVAGLVGRFQDGSVPMFVEVNGAPAVALADGGRCAGSWCCTPTASTLTALDWVVNPEKLAFAERQLSRIGGLSGLTGRGRENTHDDHAGHRATGTPVPPRSAACARPATTSAP